MLTLATGETLLNGRSTAERIKRLRDVGYRFAVGDLGAGHGSLEALADLTPEFVKIERNLVRAAAASSTGVRVVASAVALVHELGAQVVAEGIETKAEHALMLEAGCDLFQETVGGCRRNASCRRPGLGCRVGDRSGST